jgi:catechol 2,3-dioxygenase-like lactoylglutathione lyase family enzyme
MKFHHAMIVVSDIEESLLLYRDLLGFEVAMDKIVPDVPGPYQVIDQATLDDVTGVKDSNIRVLLLRSDEGMLIEMQCPNNPALQKTPKENLRYAHTGMHELALEVTDIDGWFNNIKAAGYEPQTDYVWTISGSFRTFLFYDPDGNLLQLVEGFSDEALARMGQT